MSKEPNRAREQGKHLLTPRQEQILDLVSNKLAAGDPFPSLKWIAARVGITTKRGVSIHLDALARKGYIERHTQYFELKDRGSFPFATGLAAGAAQEAFDSHERISFGPDYFGRGKLVAVKVSGESMAGDAIHDGDVVIISLGSEAMHDAIVAVRVDDREVTLKRVVFSGEMVELVPSNPDFSSLRYAAERLTIVGTYVGLVRKN
jgi:repressor LexA